MVRVNTGTVMMWCVQDEVNQEESEQDMLTKWRRKLIPQVRWGYGDGNVMYIEKNDW